MTVVLVPLEAALLRLGKAIQCSTPSPTLRQRALGTQQHSASSRDVVERDDDAVARVGADL